jgi:undecaprenyl pyrophosphate synthase
MHMVEESVTKDIATETVESVSVASGKTVEWVGKGTQIASEYLKRVIETAEKATDEHTDVTTITIGAALLCLAMFGVWFKILMTTGI